MLMTTLVSGDGIWRFLSPVTRVFMLSKRVSNVCLLTHMVYVSSYIQPVIDVGKYTQHLDLVFRCLNNMTPRLRRMVNW